MFINGFSRILGVAHEPWETEVFSEFFREAKKKFGRTDSFLLVADPYQVYQRKSYLRLRALIHDAPFGHSVVFSELFNWSRVLRRDGQELNFLERNLAICEKLGLDNLEPLVEVDIPLSPWERCPYYYPMDHQRKLRIAALIAERVLKVLEDFNPECVYFIEDENIVKWVVARWAERNGVPVRVFRGARYKDYLKVDSFFFSRPRANTNSVPPYSKKLGFSGESLYESNMAGGDKAVLRRLAEHPIRESSKVIFGVPRIIIRQLINSVLSRRFPFFWVRVYISSPLRSMVFAVQRELRLVRYAFFRKRIFTEELPEKEFILLALHMRPESSVLTQGAGVTDEGLAIELINQMKTLGIDEISLVVLENPSMVSDRPLEFYRGLLKEAGDGRIVLLDPKANTREVIEGATGVVTISGTVALEASTMGVPVHVAGRPDYLQAIASEGADLSGFLEQVRAGSGPVSEDVGPYLNSIQEAGVRGPLGWNSISTKEALDITVSNLFSLMALGTGSSK